MNHVPSFTPFPNVLIDQVMPTLKDTEWRVLCVIVRQTLGWQDSAGRGQRKERDWITRRQLKAKTHRQSAAISDAVDGLVQRGIVEVFNVAGNRLTTRQQRRRNGDKLYYRLSNAILATLRKTKQRISESEQRCLESGVQKANTTKETGDKMSPDGGERMTSRSPAQRSQSAWGRKRTSLEPPNPDVKRFLHTYIALFKQHTASGDPPPIFWGKDGKLVKQLLKAYSYDRLVDLLRQFFHSDDEWIRKTTYSIGAFQAAIGKLLVAERMTVIERRDPATGQWVKMQEERP